MVSSHVKCSCHQNSNKNKGSRTKLVDRMDMFTA